MPRTDFRSPRLCIGQPLSAGAEVTLDKAQAHYLADVLRQKPGDALLVFNGRDGEWRARLAPASKRTVVLALEEQTRPQTAPTDLHYLFAPLKRARLDYMVQKAVEMGVSRLQPVITRHTQAERVNLQRMRANAIEAAEQCGVLSLPETAEPAPLARAVAAMSAERVLIFCDEDAAVADPLVALARLGANGPVAGVRADAGQQRERPQLAVLVGPEGGFAADERAMLVARPNSVRLALGPRILRADTAAVAVLALVQVALGDWG